MKRIISVLAVMVVMAAMVAASAMPAFAAANPNANCLGVRASFFNAQGPGSGGEAISSGAKNGGQGSQASSNCTTGAN
jgi:hypothetical protein